jgi:outer membrane protein TolC
MKQTAYNVAVLLAVVGVLCSAGTAASDEIQQQQEPARLLNMTEAFELAMTGSPALDTARMATEEADAELDIARSEYQPRIEVQAMLAPMTGHHMPADINAATSYSSDLGDLSEWGVWTKINVKLYQPLYTCGKITWLNRARQLGVEVSRARENMALADTRLEVQRGFFALALTRRLTGVIEEGRGYFEKARKHLKKLEDSDDPSFDPVDTMKINVFEAQIIEREYQAKRMLELSQGQLRRLIGEDPSSTTGFETSDPEPVVPVETIDLDSATSSALQNRAELVALRTGVMAREAEAEARFRNFFPDFLLYAEFDYGYSNVVDDLTFPFYDPYRTLGFGVGLVMRFDLNIGKKLGELKKARAKKTGLAYELQGAELAVKLEIKKLFSEMNDARAMMDTRKTALKSARGWVIAKIDLYENGLVGLQDITDGLTQFFMAQLGYYQSIYDFNIAVAALERATGVALVPMPQRNLAQ